MSTVPDADRYLEMHVELVCPKCGSAGLIPWQRLDRALFCRRCSVVFRVEANRLVELEGSLRERISVQVRSSSSEWHDHKAVIERPMSAQERLRACALEMANSHYARWATAGGAILLIAASLATLSHVPDEPPPLEIPTSLDERAVLLTEAIARRDMKVLIPLTDPAQHRALRIWLAHGTDLPKAVANQDDAIEPELLSTAKTTPEGDKVDVRVRLRLPASGKDFVVNQRWVKLGGTWYFRPVRLRSPPPTTAPRAGKQRPRGGQ